MNLAQYLAQEAADSNPNSWPAAIVAVAGLAAMVLIVWLVSRD